MTAQELKERLKDQAIFVLPVPYNFNHTIDDRIFWHLVRRICEENGRVFALGQSSGLYTMSEDEIVRLIYGIKFIAGYDCTVIFPMRTSMLGVAKKLFDESKADAILVMPPSIHHTLQDLIDYHKYLRYRLPEVPLILYNDNELVIRELIEDEIIDGVKWPRRATHDFAHLAETYPDLSWQVAVGESSNYHYPIANCYWTGNGVVWPELVLKQVKSFSQGDIDHAIQIGQCFINLDNYRREKDGLHSIAAIYHLLELVGFPIGEPRPPIHSLTIDEEQRLQRIFEEIETEKEHLTSPQPH